MLAKLKNESLQLIPDIIKSPYLLEFIGIEEKTEYSETNLEQAIINHLQKFLIEMGRGFCFEARQKRITFSNRHYPDRFGFLSPDIEMPCVNRSKSWRI
ncbi:MAG: PDDEXK nuclease domain-containing protein [Bacteroidota bacterium]|nr:PDDEXK nuclease domain-containing protein [Bacteroidota bacterium]